MSTQDFLVEIGTEELPPKALRSLSKAFEAGVRAGLEKEALAFSAIKAYATPRRLALLVSGLDTQQQDKRIERLGPAVKAAFKDDGSPTPAAAGFAKSCGVDITALEQQERDGVVKLAYASTVPGQATAALLPGIVDKALAQLPIPKRMRWGSSRVEFVRPVHWLVLLFGSECIDAEILGIQSGTATYGHRFHHNLPIAIKRPADYETLLENTGSVIADFQKRKDLIRQLVMAEAERIGATVVIDDDLLDEVTSLVEFPVALMGEFDAHFLEVPSEALILAMKSHQKCFYLTDAQGSLLPRFITVSNIRSTDPAQVIEGNERVIRPRLADARFFFETDKQASLASRSEQLKKIVFQQDLGTVFEKSERVAALAAHIGADIGGNPDYCARAALLAKCDLLTNMVGEFADLQGLMGYYYALADGEPEEVAIALNEQYMPRFAGDALPTTLTGSVLAVADKLDSIVGMFVIGQPPTGSKDPFALRRAAIGVLRILVERTLDLNLLSAIDSALQNFAFLKIPPATRVAVFDFLLERFRAWYLEEGVSAEVFQSVIALKPERPLDFHKRIDAVNHFSKLPQSQALAAANKRVTNILAKLDQSTITSTVDGKLLQEPAELALFEALTRLQQVVNPLFDAGDYRDGLQQLASLKDCVDGFFDEVLVMCEDPGLQKNRIALLSQLRNMFLRVADISCLHNG